MESNANQVIVNNIKEKLLGFMLDLFAKDKIARNYALTLSQRVVQMIIETLEQLECVAKDKSIHYITRELQRKDFYSSEYLFMKELEKSQIFFPPEKIVLSNRLTYAKGISEKPEITVLPLQKMYTALFNKTDILPRIIERIEEIRLETEEDASRGVISIQNAMQGTLWTDALRTLNLENAAEQGVLVLPLNFSFDDFQPLNPLGTKNNIHKVGAKYAKIGVLPKSLNSKFKTAFQLVSLFSSDVREENGNGPVFAHILEEIKKLRVNGIQITNERYNQTYKCVKLIPLILSGDNLGIAQINGISPSFRSTWSCFRCNLPFSDPNVLTVAPNNLRSRENYENDVLNGTNGVLEESCFNGIHGYGEHFHFISHAGIDLMHGIKQGLISDFLPFIVKRCELNIEALNERIVNFDFGPAVENRPHTFKTDGKFSSTSASEAKYLLLAFPYLVYDMIDTSSKEWKLLINLRKFVKLLYRRKFDLVKDISSLNGYVATIRELSIEFDHRITFKNHTMSSHIASQISEMGVPADYSTELMEAKHFDVKQTDLNCKINICKTMAIKQQLKFARILFYGLDYHEGLKGYASKSMDAFLKDYDDIFDWVYRKVQSIISYYELNAVPLYSKYSKNGAKLKKGFVFEYPSSSGSFYEVTSILGIKDKDVVFVVTRKIKTQMIDTTMQAYRVRYQNDTDLQKHISNSSCSIRSNYEIFALQDNEFQCPILVPKNFQKTSYVVSSANSLFMEW